MPAANQSCNQFATDEATTAKYRDEHAGMRHQRSTRIVISPLRRTCSTSVLPPRAAAARQAALKAAVLATRTPLAATMTSPWRSPALAARLLGAMLRTSTPPPLSGASSSWALRAFRQRARLGACSCCRGGRRIGDLCGHAASLAFAQQGDLYFVAYAQQADGVA